MRKARSSARVVLAAALVLGVGWTLADVGAGKPAREGPSAKTSAQAAPRATGGPQNMPSETEASPAQAAESKPAPLSAEQVAQLAQLKDRVEKRWDALIARDFAKAYTFETPEYRKEQSLERYSAHFGTRVKWVKAEVKEVRYDHPGEATAVVALTYSFDLPTDEEVQTTSSLREQWVRVDDAWWHKDKQQPLGGGNRSESSQRK